MATNYTMAAKRHFHDADLLGKEGRHANTSHLAGVAAECALKSILFGLRILTLKSGKPWIQKGAKVANVGVHVNKFWDEFQISIQGPASSVFAGSMLLGANPFCDWLVEQRYEEDAAVSEVRAVAHMEAARQVMKAFQEAETRGQVQ